MWRGIGIGTAIGGMVLLVAAASAQSQRSPATLDDLLTEVRRLRGDLARSSTSGIRAQVVVGRAQLQEQRVAALRSELAQLQFQLRLATQQRERTDTVARDVEEGIRSGNLAADRVRQLERELADMKDRLLIEQRLESELRYKEGELANMLAGEQNRWLDFNARLDDLERALTR
jgi:hypothetical protein